MAAKYLLGLVWEIFRLVGAEMSVRFSTQLMSEALIGAPSSLSLRR